MPKRKGFSRSEISDKVRGLFQTKHRHRYEGWGELNAFALKLFGSYADRYKEYFLQLKPAIVSSDMKVLLRTYISIMMLFTASAFLLSFAFTLLFTVMLGLDLLFAFAGLLLVPSAIASIVFSIMYTYPGSVAGNRRTDIDANLPFAAIHMSAIAGSGVSTHAMFRILAQFREYGEISEESEKIVRNIEVFGLDEISAMREVIAKTPSPSFKALLDGMATTIQTGGNLKEYLRQQADRTLLDYRLARERYAQDLSTYADFYTALLIAAPLLMISVLAVLGVIGGDVFGMPIDQAIFLGTYIVLPVLNVAFIAFLHATQPRS